MNLSQKIKLRLKLIKRWWMRRRFHSHWLDRIVVGAFYRIPARFKRYPEQATSAKASKLYDQHWYYSIELHPGRFTKGIQPKNYPFLPRMLMHNCALTDMDCLDLGSMEGLMPTLMVRKGARNVLAADAWYHCFNKICAVKHYYGVDFAFRQVGLLYDLSQRLSKFNRRSFDFINLSGILYHVFSPMMVLSGVRPLLKKNGLMIVSTNVIERPDYSMDFNVRGLLQAEKTTYWYLSVPFFDYVLRYFKLLPIDCLYHPYEKGDPIRYYKHVKAGYLSVVCRAMDEITQDPKDEWMERSQAKSWEYIGFCDVPMIEKQRVSNIEYRPSNDHHLLLPDKRGISLDQAIKIKTPVRTASRLEHTHILSLEDDL